MKKGLGYLPNSNLILSDLACGVPQALLAKLVTPPVMLRRIRVQQTSVYGIILWVTGSNPQKKKVIRQKYFCLMT